MPPASYREMTLSPGKPRFARAMNAAAPAVWDWDVANNLFLISDRLREICGFASGEPVDFEAFCKITYPGDRAWMETLDPAPPDLTFLTNRDIRYRIQRADTGELRWINAHIVSESAPDGSGKAAGYTGTIEDITEQVVADHALIESGERLRLAVEAGKMAIWEVDLETGTITNTPELNRLFGFPPDAKPAFQDFRSRYAPGELERIAKEGATLEAVRARFARGEFQARKDAPAAEGTDRTQVQAEVSIVIPTGAVKRLLYRAQYAFSTEGRPRITGFLVDITERKLAEERLSIVARELRHRVKNSLAVVQAIAYQTFRAQSDTDTAMQTFLGRLRALSTATDIVLDGDEASDADLLDVVHSITKPYRISGLDPFIVNGTTLRLRGKVVTAIGMVLHELCTNAVKYGALSLPTGQVTLEWQIAEGGKIALDWQEGGGPTVLQPARKGFGTRLLELLVAGELRGSLGLAFEPAGLRCRIVTGSLIEPAGPQAG